MTNQNSGLFYSWTFRNWWQFFIGKETHSRPYPKTPIHILSLGPDRPLCGPGSRRRYFKRCAVDGLTGLTLEGHGIGKRYREQCDRRVYMSSGPVCAAQMGANFRQFSGTVPLWAGAACTVFPSGTGAATNQILFTSERFPLPVFRSWANLVEWQIRICHCHWLPDPEESLHAGSAFCHWITHLTRKQEKGCSKNARSRVLTSIH